MKPFRKAFTERKGQAEIFGLVIVMILLIFALLFFIKVRQDDSSNVSLRSNFRANNLLNAVINVDTSYEDGGDVMDIKMKDWLKKCINAYDEFSTIDWESNKCNDLILELETIFGSVVLGSESVSFRGSISRSNDIPIKIGDCLEGITASPVRLPGYYVFELKLCSN